MIRVGQGGDIHALVLGRKLIIGGVEIPYEYGLLGHSAADVLLHAIIDALLGAAGQGDIGRHFPDSVERYRGVDSGVLLRCSGELLAHAGWRIVNDDSTINVQRPKMWPHLTQKMCIRDSPKEHLHEHFHCIDLLNGLSASGWVCQCANRSQCSVFAWKREEFRRLSPG